jgi:hypothetical protein
MSEVNKPEQLGVTESGDWEYPSGSAEGYVEVEVPSLPGSINPTERLHMRDFGSLVVGKIESSINTGYLRQQSPAQVFKHYAAVARGASLMDEQALKRMDDLAAEFESVPERDEYYKQVVRPWLHSLTSKRRG